MEKQRTNNGPLKESADKHSIYTLVLGLTFKQGRSFESITAHLRGLLTPQRYLMSRN